MSTRRRKVVLLGMVTKIPVAGVAWQVLHYLLGFEGLGYETYYVEAHGRTPSMFMSSEDDDGSALAAGYLERLLSPYGLGDRWAYQALHDDGRCYGLSEAQLRDLYRSAELIVNLHGGTEPRAEHAASGRLVYVETDPGQLQVELAEEWPDTVAFLEQHCAFFTFAENWGGPGCALPPTRLFPFRPTRQPVVLDLWEPAAETRRSSFTTVGNYRQEWRDIRLGGETYTWTKNVQFDRILSLPSRVHADFELTLSGYEEPDRARLEQHGWRVAPALPFSLDLAAYQDYIRNSLGEFTVAKDQNVRLRTGWFSDRSASYLAAGRPVVTEDTGFGDAIPTGPGLSAFRDLDGAVAAVETVLADYDEARRSAREIAASAFASEVVLTNLLDAVGVDRPGRGALVTSLPLVPRARRPLVLADGVEERVRLAPVPFAPSPTDAVAAESSVVVVSYDNLALTRLCLESVLAATAESAFELIVVDNGSRDGTAVYLRTLERRFPQVRVIANAANVGFPRACNQGLAVASGELLVLLNNDTIVPAGWLTRLAAHARRPEVGLVGPVTNRIGNEAEVPVEYATYDGFLAEAAARATEFAGVASPLPMPAMFCLAFRRDVFERIGPLDERFGLGTLEDDDYARRAAACGLELLCAEDVLVHHFGEASFGRLVPSGRYVEILDENRRLFEEKWGDAWRPYDRRRVEEYEQVKERVRGVVRNAVPQGSTVLVVSRGDDELLALDGRRGVHFPQDEPGIYAGHYPEDSAAAIAALERLRSDGCSYFVVPRPGLWWLEHYDGFAAHLADNAVSVVRDEACVLYELREVRA
jgi:GT2 family glycosyltransferase